MNPSQAIPTLSALAEPTRLEILRHVIRAGEAGVSAGDIAQAVGASPSRASFHLNVMAGAKLIRADKKSRNVIYAPQIDTLADLMRYLMVDCCAGHADVMRCCASTAPNVKPRNPWKI